MAEPTATPDRAEIVAAHFAGEATLADAHLAYKEGKEAALATLREGKHDRDNPLIAAGRVAWIEGGEVRSVKIPAA